MTHIVANLSDVGVTDTSIDRSAPSNHTVQIVVTGSVLPTAITVAFEGSINDGDAFAVMNTHVFDATEITLGIALFHITNKGVSHVRVRVVSVEGGTDLAIAIWARDSK